MTNKELLDFSGLTPKQQELLTYQGWYLDSDRPQPRERTVAELIKRGLVIEHTRPWIGVTFKEYEVPIPVHMAWCAHCAAAEIGKQKG
jgi:hypothetical protein